MKKIRAYSDTGFSLPDDAVIVSLSLFPPNGEWGGAIRSREISNAIKQVFPKSYTIHCHSLPTTWEDMPEFLKGTHPQLDDISWLYKNFYTANHISSAPDAIIFDHPWLWNEAKRLKERYPETKIIHSSHNVEFLLKRKLLEGLDEQQINDVVNFVEDIESEIASRADLIVCVTEKDSEWFKKNGAKNVVVANNGTNASIGEIEIPEHYALVVGSAHPPNIEGSIHYLKNAVEWLPDKTDLVFIGSMSYSIKGKLGPEFNEEKKTSIRLFGIVSDDVLNYLISSANVIVLPIPYGGGSNLKTAEALVSGRPVVGTSASFRSFEKHATDDFVRIADSKSEFRNLVSQACMKKYPTVYRDAIDSLGWNSTTKPLRDYLEANRGTSS